MSIHLEFNRFIFYFSTNYKYGAFNKSDKFMADHTKFAFSQDIF